MTAFDGAFLKIDRASKHVVELNELVQKSQPFTYIVETNVETGERVTRPKKNETVIKSVALISGDAVHNLRTALDHAYWSIVSPHATNDRERRAVQFPFSETAARLDEGIKNRLADRVSPEFFSAMQALRPHGEPGGNANLYLVHELDVIDKHRLLIPTADYTKVTGTELARQIHNFPSMFSGMMQFGGNGRGDLSWHDASFIVPRNNRLSQGIPLHGILEQKLDVPVDITFQIGTQGAFPSVIPTLYRLVDVCKEVVRIMIDAVN